MCSQATYEFDGILVSPDRRRVASLEVEIEFRDGSSSPAQYQMGLGGVALLDRDVGFLQERAKQFLTIAGSGGWGFPYAHEIAAEAANALALLIGQAARTLTLPLCQFVLCGCEVS